MRIFALICLAAFVVGAASADHVVIGYRTYMATYPFFGCWATETVRCQDLVLKDDGLIAGTVTRWEWYTSSLIISGVVHNFWIKLSHTSRDKLVDDFELNYDGHKPVKVFATEDMGTIPPSYTWFGFDFSPGFEYNGEDNLIVEVYWKDRDGTLSIGTFWTPYEARCCMCVGISTTEPAVFDFVHYMRATISPIAVEPTSLGRVKAVFQ